MENFQSFEFNYRGKTYCALMRTRRSQGVTRHAVTIMNGDLERLLHGHHIIIEQDGLFSVENPSLSREIGELSTAVLKAVQLQSERTRVPMEYELHGISRVNHGLPGL